MASSFGYWQDCTDPRELKAMWKVPEVRTEWLAAGEVKGQKVHISRDPDGQPYLTQTEMRAVAEIVVRKHFHSEIDPAMICAIAEIESDRQLLVVHSDRKSKESKMGIMQLAPKTAEWLMSSIKLTAADSELGYRYYKAEESKDFLFRPFVNVYFGAACIRWLSTFSDQKRSEEFIVRAYKGGTKKATHKLTLPYWKLYLSVKESLPSRKSVDDHHVHAMGYGHAPLGSLPPISEDTVEYNDWDSRASLEDMEEMWNHPDVGREWSKSGEIRGKVRFAKDEIRRPYLSKTELKAVADIILFRYFSTKGIKPAVLCALAEIISRRYVHGNGAHTGIMGVNYSTAYWLYVELSYRAYRVDSADDLNKPFVSMYFGAAYVAWLSEYEGRKRSQEFIVQAYLEGPENVGSDSGPLRLRFKEALGQYTDSKKNHDSCSIM